MSTSAESRSQATRFSVILDAHRQSEADFHLVNGAHKTSAIFEHFRFLELINLAEIALCFVKTVPPHIISVNYSLEYNNNRTLDVAKSSFFSISPSLRNTLPARYDKYL